MVNGHPSGPHRTFPSIIGKILLVTVGLEIPSFTCLAPGPGGFKAGLSWPLLHMAWLLPAPQLERQTDRPWESRGSREQGFLLSLQGGSTPTHPEPLCPIPRITNMSPKPVRSDSWDRQSHYRSTCGVWMPWKQTTSGQCLHIRWGFAVVRTGPLCRIRRVFCRQRVTIRRGQSELKVLVTQGLPDSPDPCRPPQLAHTGLSGALTPSQPPSVGQALCRQCRQLQRTEDTNEKHCASPTGLTAVSFWKNPPRLAAFWARAASRNKWTSSTPCLWVFSGCLPPGPEGPLPGFFFLPLLPLSPCLATCLLKRLKRLMTESPAQSRDE